MSNLLLTGLTMPFTWILRVFLAIDSLIYWLVAQAYEIFMLVANAQLFDSNNEVIVRITTNIYSILGIAMLFVFAYNILNLIINPDKLNDRSDNSVLGIIKNLIISLIIIALLPQIFNYTYKLQNRILQSGVLSSIILGGTGSDDSEADITSAGRNIAINLFSAFYYPITSDGKPYTYQECVSGQTENKPAICDDYVNAMDNAINNSSIWAFTENKTLANALDDGDLKYIWFISAAAGIFAVYLFISFALDVGIRVVKLGVLQIIAPIPVVMRITKPKGGVYDKWFKEITKTYLMVFERLIVIYFAIATISIFCGEHGIIANLPDNASSADIITRLLAKVILILGTLSFAKSAPKMLEDLFGMKIGEIGIKKKLDENTYAKKMAGVGVTAGLGTAGGAIRRFNAAKERNLSGVGRVGSFISGGIGGALGGGLRGIKADYGKGSEGFKKAVISTHQSNMEQGVKNEATRLKVEGVSHIPVLNMVVGTGSNIIDSVKDVRGEIKDMVGDNGVSSLQSAVTIESDLKKSISSFMDTWANKGQYSNAKASRDNNAKEIVAGKITSDELSKRLTRVSGANLTVDGNTGDVTRRLADGTTKIYKNNMNELTKLNADIYKEMMQTMQGENLAKIVKAPDGSADFVNSKKQLDTRIKSLERDFQSKANSIPREQRESILQEFEKLGSMNFTNLDEAKAYGIQLNNISDALENYININNNNLTSSNN
jgi:hypothetical protein